MMLHITNFQVNAVTKSIETIIVMCRIDKTLCINRGKDFIVVIKESML